MRTVHKTLLIATLATVASATSQFALAQTVTISSPWELKAEDPTVGGFAFTRMGVTEPLLGISKDGKLEPKLATDWSVSDDKTVWTITLRDGVTFTDGETLTAEGVVTALKHARANPSPFKKAPVKSIKAQDGNVVITLEKPYSVLPSMLAHYTTMILSPKSYGADGKVSKIIGTGPFVIDNFQPPQKMDIVKNNDYWGEKAHIDRAEYLAVSRGETRALMAESNDAIMTYSLDPASLSRLEKNDKLRVQSIMLPRVMLIKLNNAHELMKDVNVRRALSMAIDRKGIAIALMRASETSPTQLFPPSLTQWHNKDVKPFTYDPEAAKALLEKSGFTFNKDGYAEKDGKVFEITLRTYSDRPKLPLIAKAVQDQFKKIGVKLNISIASYTEIPSGHQDGTLEMGLISRNYSQLQSPLNGISTDFGKNGEKWGGDWGAMNWKNQAVADALEALKLDNADENADKNRAIIAKAIQEEMPIIPISWYKESVVVTNNLEGVTLDPFDTTYRLNEIKVKK